MSAKWTVRRWQVVRSHLGEGYEFGCRYMVILRYGGVYADVDTECGRPLNDFIKPDDSFVAGWEDEYATAEMAVKFRFARQRQLEQWVFAAEPKHPALQVTAFTSAMYRQLIYASAIMLQITGSHART